MIDVSEAFEEFIQSYSRTRYTIVNSYNGEQKVASTATIRAYIHPDDYKAIQYNGQGQRLEERVKIFCKVGTDLEANDEVTYFGKTYKVNKEAPRFVGSYIKLIAELVR